MMLTLKNIRLFIALILIALAVPYANAQDLNQQQVQLIANKLLVSKKYHEVSIKKILPAINGIYVVLLNVPYREFPSIIVITQNKNTHKASRVFECLSPGIQDKPSGLLDWHTKGEGVDFEIDKTTTNDFSDNKIRAVTESAFEQQGVVIIPYQNFIHMNSSTDPIKEFEPYTIDKTQYYNFANVLFDGNYKNYAKDNCMMYDTPAITNCEFTYTGNTYTIIATTNNSQVWTYTFDGVDTQDHYFLNKKITVSKAL